MPGRSIYFGLSRPRPYGVPIIGSWGGYSGVSPPAAVLTFFLMGAVYCLAVPGRARSWTKAAVAAVVAVFGLARLYLGLDHPGDVLLGVAFAVAIAVTAFRYFTPNEVFPVAYRRGRTAHVDVTGRRGEAIRQAVRDQLGLTVAEIKPVGLESSAGSTPLRLRVEDGPDEFVFAKLYTKGHVRADRWYKLWRTILYGSLEDEHPFQSVRRLVEYEDYALRLLQDIGVRTARPYGIVEITPEREYMLVTEFHTGAAEIGEADVDDEVIDQGLLLIRTLWDAGIAHRDIKPGNLMVRSGELLLIDVAFVQVRPSPWRQAVDLGNMMLVLAVRTGPQRVYRRALALLHRSRARRGVRRHPRGGQPDPAARVHEAGPARPARRIPRPGPGPAADRAATLEHPAGRPGGRDARHHHRRRVRTGDAFFPAARNLGAHAPACGTGHSMILSAQAVPSAALLPCIAALPSGWQIGGADIASGKSSFWLDSDRAGQRAATITLAATCDTAGARQIPSDQPGTRRFERPLSLVPQFSGLRFYTFPGGCVTYQFRFSSGVSPVLAGTRHHRGRVRAPVEAGQLRPADRGSRPVRARGRMSRMSWPAAPVVTALMVGRIQRHVEGRQRPASIPARPITVGAGVLVALGVPDRRIGPDGSPRRCGPPACRSAPSPQPTSKPRAPARSSRSPVTGGVCSSKLSARTSATPTCCTGAHGVAGHPGRRGPRSPGASLTGVGLGSGRRCRPS